MSVLTYTKGQPGKSPRFFSRSYHMTNTQHKPIPHPRSSAIAFYTTNNSSETFNQPPDTEY